MPRIGDLQNCKIYKITSLNNPDMVYYGHTCQTLARRFATHKSNYNTSTSKLIIELGNAVILLVENFPCETEDQARAREAEYILNNECVNKNIPGRTEKQYYQDNKEKLNEQQKKYYEEHKEKLNEQQKIYNEDNKEHYLEYQKQYNQDNKEKIALYKKEWRKQKKIKEQQNLTTTELI